MFKKSVIFLAWSLGLSSAVYADPNCEFTSVQELENVLGEIGINKSSRTRNDVINEYIHGLRNKSDLILILLDKLQVSDLNVDLTPQFLSEFVFLSKNIDIDNVDLILTKLKYLHMDIQSKSILAFSAANIDPSVLDSAIFATTEFFDLPGTIADYYPFLKNQAFNEFTQWSDIPIAGGVNNRSEIVVNNIDDLDEKAVLYSISDALNNSSINSSLESRLSNLEGFNQAWQRDIEEGNISNPQFFSGATDAVFRELFYLINRQNSDMSWRHLFDFYKNTIIPQLAYAVPKRKINFYDTPNYVDLAYDKMSVNNPIHRQWLEQEGFLDDSGEIDWDFMEQEGNAFPNLEETVPKHYLPVSQKEMEQLVSRSIKGDPEFQDTEVILWRGTDGEHAEKIAKHQTGGGDPRTEGEVPRPTKEDADLQVSKGGHIPEYSVALNVTDQFSRGHYAVAIKVKLKYLRSGSVSEQGWVLYHDAPVDVLMIIDRTNGLPEKPSTGNGS